MNLNIKFGIITSMWTGICPRQQGHFYPKICKSYLARGQGTGRRMSTASCELLPRRLHSRGAELFPTVTGESLLGARVGPLSPHPHWRHSPPLLPSGGR